MQLFPYGWRLPDGSIMREADYRGMAEAKNATYYSWVNPYPQHGHFRRFEHTSCMAAATTITVD